LQLTEGLLFEVALDRWTRAVNRMAGLLARVGPGSFAAAGGEGSKIGIGRGDK
jgi:hypothetical protein